MAQNRKPPAYQEYPAQMLASHPFRLMDLQDRGLLYTLRLECWANERLPKDPETLSKILGLPRDQVEQSLAAVMPFFKISNGFIACPELDDYRQHLNERNLKLSKAGKNGAEKKKLKTGNYLSNEDSATITPPLSQAEATLKPPLSPLVQSSKVKQSQNQFSKKRDSDNTAFIEEYEAAERGEQQANNFVRI